MRFLRYVAAVLGLFAVHSSISFAQSELPPEVRAPLSPADSSDSPPARDAAELEAVGLDTYLLPDKDGRLQPMLGWTFEDFIRVWKAREAAPIEQEPAFSLQRLEGTGRLEEDGFVRLDVRVQIRLQTDRRTAVPLGFPNAVLTAYEVSPQPQVAYLHFDDDLGEHVLWIQGTGIQGTGIQDAGIQDTADGAIEVRLELLLPLARRGAESLLRFHPPRAVTSRLALTVPGGEVLVDSGLLPMQVTSTSSQGETTIEARGLAETSEIAWRTLGEGGGGVWSLVADSQVRAQVEPALLRTEVSMTVQNLHGALRRFRIRLPAHSKLVADDLPAATLHLVNPPSSRGLPADQPADPAEGALYEVRLLEPQQAPFHAKFSLERPLSLREDETPLRLEGIHVVGALREQGTLQLLVGEDLRVRWQEGHRVRQIARPAEATADADLLAAFEYDAADWQLPVLLALRPTEISVEPDYTLQVGREELRLTAVFRYSVRGTKRIDLRFALGAWELADDPLGPGSTISGGNTYVDRAGTMYLPLANPAEGTFETTLHLKMQRPETSGVLQVRLPECLDGRAQDGRLQVVSDPSLEVLPQTQALVGLGPEVRPASAAAPPEPAERSSQRFRISSTPIEYVAVVRPRTRQIASESRVMVDVHADRLQIEQTLRLDIRHLPTNEVVLEAPAALADSPVVSYEVDGEMVVPVWEDATAENDAAATTRIARLVLDQPRQGELSIRILFQLPLGGSPSGDLVQDVLVPLAVPRADAHHVLASLTNYTNELQVQWRRAGGSESASGGGRYSVANPGGRVRLEAATPTLHLPVSVRAAPAASQRTVMVDRTWIQSWIAGNSMQVRTVMRFVPSSSDFVLLLDPAGASDLLDVKINGQTVGRLPEADRELVLRAEDLQSTTPCVVEVLQQGPFEVGPDGRLAFTPPRVADARYDEVYWQLVLPKSWHGFDWSDAFVSASPWRNQGVYWARIPAVSQSELEERLDVGRGPAPVGAVNELLLHGFELPESLSVSLVRRSTLVLTTSGIVLVAGLIVLYARRLQRLELLVAAVLGLAIGGTVYPGIAPLIAQAGTLGLILIVIAVFLKRIMDQWQSAAAGGAADTSIFRREASSGGAHSTAASGAETPSSARTFVPSLPDPEVQHSAS